MKKLILGCLLLLPFSLFGVEYRLDTGSIATPGFWATGSNSQVAAIALAPYFIGQFSESGSYPALWSGTSNFSLQSGYTTLSGSSTTSGSASIANLAYSGTGGSFGSAAFNNISTFDLSGTAASLVSSMQSFIANSGTSAFSGTSSFTNDPRLASALQNINNQTGSNLTLTGSTSISGTIYLTGTTTIVGSPTISGTIIAAGFKGDAGSLTGQFNGTATTGTNGLFRSSAFKDIGDPSILSGGSGNLNLSNFTITLPTMTINFRHDYYSALQTVTFGVAEPAWAIDYHRLYIGDGITHGGLPVGLYTLTGTGQEGAVGYAFTSPYPDDVTLISSSINITDRWDSLVFYTSGTLVPIVARYSSTTSGTTYGNIMPLIADHALLGIPAIFSGTGTNANTYIPKLNAVTYYNGGSAYFSNGSSSSSGTGGMASDIPGLLITQGGSGGSTSGAGYGGDASNSSNYGQILMLSLGNGGGAVGVGNGGNGGTMSSPVDMITIGSGGAGNVGNGGTGGSIGRDFLVISGNGGAGGSSTGATGGNGGSSGALLGSQGLINLQGGNGGTGGTATNAVGGNGGGLTLSGALINLRGGDGGVGGSSTGAVGGNGGTHNSTTLSFVGGNGGAGGTYNGGNGGNFGYAQFQGGVGGAGTGSTNGGTGGNAGYLQLNGGIGSTSGGNGGTGGGFISNGGAASNATSGNSGGILNLSATASLSSPGTITYGDGYVITIPDATGTLALTSALGTVANKNLGDPTILSGGSGNLNLSNFTLTLPTMTINFRHDYYSALQTITLGVGEPAWAIDYKKLFVGDGSTLGGIPVTGVTQITGSDWTTPFSTSSTNDLYYVTGTAPAFAGNYTLVARTGTIDTSLLWESGTGEGTIQPTFNSGLIWLIPTTAGTGTNPNNSTYQLGPIWLVNPMADGNSYSTGTGGNCPNYIPSILFTINGNGGTSSGSGNGGNATYFYQSYSLAALSYGYGGSTIGAGSGGNGGIIMGYAALDLFAGYGGNGGADNGGNGGGLNPNSSITIAGGNGGNSGSVSGATGGVGGAGAGTCLNPSTNFRGNLGIITISGGNGGNGGSTSVATGGAGGSIYSPNNAPFEAVGGPGGSGVTQAGGNGGNYGSIIMAGGTGGDGSGSSTGGNGGSAGYLYVNGGNGSTSGGNGGNAGGFISNGGSATNGVSGVAGGILNLSASSNVSISGSITWGNGSILTIPAITGTLVTTTGSTSYSGSTGSVTPINVQDGLLGAGVLVQSATNFVMSGSASITGNLGLSGSLTLGIGSTVDSFVGNIISGQSAVVLESTIPENGGVEGGIIITNQNSNSNKWLFQAVYADDGGDNGMVFTAAGNGSAYGGNGYADGDIVFKANDSTVCRFQSSSSSGGYGSPIVMKDDGSISWGNANGLLGSDGSLTVGNGSGVANINASDGSASFASGNIFFKASPVELDFSVGGSQKFSLGYDSTHITFYNNSGSFGFMVWDSGELSVGTDFYTPTNNPIYFNSADGSASISGTMQAATLSSTTGSIIISGTHFYPHVSAGVLTFTTTP